MAARRCGARAVFTALGLVCVLGLALAGLLVRGVISLNAPPRDRYPIWGVDVSHYQGAIDWEALAEQGVRFAFIKATEGSAHTDENYLANARGAARAGVPAGAYHFFSFESPGETQAENLLSQLKAHQTALPCAVDFEFYGDFFQNPPDVEQVRAQLRAMLAALEAELGYKPLIYATQKSYGAYLEGAFDDYPLWIRNVYLWPSLPEGREWTFWQYSDRGRLEGYRGDEERIDLNVFNGGEAAFAAYLAER